MYAQSILSGQPSGACVETRAVVDPWTGERLGDQALVGPQQIDAAMAAAFGARAACQALPPWRRAEILHAMATGVAARKDALVGAIVREAGKPVRFARGEVDRCVDTLTFAAEEAKRPAHEVVDLGAVAAGQGRTGLVKRYPAGVVVGIAPFNFPLNLVAHKIAPAIAAGCPWIIKPGDPTPTPALILAELAVAAGWPADAAHVLLLSRGHAPLLVSDERPAIVSFTGSDRVGWAVKAQAGRKRVLLELGGAAPAIVLADADLDLAAERIAFGAFAYAGQVCISVQRVVVAAAVADALRERLVARTTHEVPWGDPWDDATVSGPMVGEDHADRVVAWWEEAEGRGARRLAGGAREGARLLAPALHEAVPHDCDLYRRELFGPGVLLEVARDTDHALALADEGPWGLQAGIFTSDVQALMQAHDRLAVGGIIHDDVPTFRVDHMPYGGIAQSGLGREGLRYAIAEYTEPRMLALRQR
ncbi:MAG: aldehyde dehydrogenase family protein [Alphaproteobacteria bacterium]|nr:aldehyde dehydrogenase family protein [Alphaproteobacteria bacterium]